MVQAFVKSVAYMSPRRIRGFGCHSRNPHLARVYCDRDSLGCRCIRRAANQYFYSQYTIARWSCHYKNNKIAASCAYLPLTESSGISKEFGTRHRAAIGLSEVSDAFTFVVSEETGGISTTTMEFSSMI